jgi:hypothetical protein
MVILHQLHLTRFRLKLTAGGDAPSMGAQIESCRGAGAGFSTFIARPENTFDTS